MDWRGFYALDVPAPLSEELKPILRGFAKFPGINWVSEQNLHLTLLFMAEVPFDKTSALKQLSLDAAQNHEPFMLKALGIELFPAKEPRLVWLKLEAQEPSIFSLQKTLQNGCRDLGVGFDKKALKLHITLGRIKRQIPAQWEQQIMLTPLKTQEHYFDTLTLYRSQLSPKGPKYTILEQSKLR